MADDDERRSLLIAVAGAREQMHHRTAQALAPTLLVFGALADPSALRAAVDPAAPYATRRASASAELRRQSIALDVRPTWRDTVRDAHTAAAAGGVYAAGHVLSAGAIAAAPDSSDVDADPFNPDRWIDAQLDGMGGDLAYLLAGDGADLVDDGDLTATVSAGAGALYYLDEQTSDAFLDGSAQQYEATGVATVLWFDMADGRVCGTCRSLTEGSPYPVASYPDVPHGACRCWIIPT